MPYNEGRRISQNEYVRLKRISEGRDPDEERFHTGPNGANPGSAPELDPETGAPPVERKVGKRRSKRSEASAKAAVANALGVKTDSATLADIDITGLDAEENE
jgi:hypothetical protein